MDVSSRNLAGRERSVSMDERISIDWFNQLFSRIINVQVNERRWWWNDRADFVLLFRWKGNQTLCPFQFCRTCSCRTYTIYFRRRKNLTDPLKFLANRLYFEGSRLRVKNHNLTRNRRWSHRRCYIIDSSKFLMMHESNISMARCFLRRNYGVDLSRAKISTLRDRRSTFTQTNRELETHITQLLKSI